MPTHAAKPARSCTIKLGPELGLPRVRGEPRNDPLPPHRCTGSDKRSRLRVIRVNRTQVFRIEFLSPIHLFAFHFLQELPWL